MKQPSFNFHPIKSGLYCSTHKLDGMVNVTINHCEYIDQIYYLIWDIK
jgi:hypothetical protein